MKFKYRLHNFLIDYFSNLYVKKFKTLEEMNEWIESKKCKILCKLGILQPYYHSPMQLSCVLDETNIHMDYIESLNEENLKYMCEKYLKDKNKWCKCEGKHNCGYFVGIEVTQEDLYWVLFDDTELCRQLKYCTGASDITVVNEEWILKR